MRATLTLSYAVPNSARVMQVAAMTDVPIDQELTRHWDVTLPLDEQPWNVGLISGPSGAGKTSLARELWPKAFVAPQWTDRPLVDDFPDGLGVHQVQDALVAAGLGSVPAWLRPYHTLSGGEQFRADVARMLADPPVDGQIAVIDEYTSTVDRQVARVASHALQKSVRRDKRQVVAVSCHDDIVDWLQPDWVLDAASGQFSWRSLRRHPAVVVDVCPAERRLWALFAHHHYLSGQLHPSARCFAAYVHTRPVAFLAYMHYPHPSRRAQNMKIGHRLVVLPDWQGLGIGTRFTDCIAQQLAEQGFRMRVVIAHPGMAASLAASPRWREKVRQPRLINTSKRASLRKRALSPRYLSTRAFEYMPPAEPTNDPEAI